MASGEKYMDATKLLDDEPGVVPYEVLETSEDLSVPSNDEIAELAYSYYAARGYTGGSPLEDWLRAERELTKQTADAPTGGPNQ